MLIWRHVVLTLIRIAVITTALGLFIYEEDYQSNRRAYQIPTSGRTIWKVEIDDCYRGWVSSGDFAFDRDYEQALRKTCVPWLQAHYLKLGAIMFVAFILVLASERILRPGSI